MTRKLKKSSRNHTRIAIDLTPILPGGSNGGAKIMSLQLIKELIKLEPNNEYILLVSQENQAELMAIKAPNISIICTSSLEKFNIRNSLLLLFGALLWPFFQLAKRILPAYIKTRLMHRLHQLHSNFMARNLARKVEADLLFCPFTAPFYHQLNIPIVSVIYDLQSQYHPHFFSSEERYERKKHFDEACQKAAKLVCISDFVNQTVKDNSQLAHDKIKTIHIRLAHRLPQLEKTKIAAYLKNHELTEDQFLLYPANFWAHKNHLMLFTAFNIYRTKHPQSKLKLVCTGADSEHKQFLLNAIKEMGLAQWIMLPGYLSDEEFASLVTSCRAIIFPSLYEGFGMPVLEAMAAGKPVLCSNLTSLPEVAGSAAVLFDPRKPEDIATAIQRIDQQPDLVQQLIQLGYERLAVFGTETDMAKEYLQVFHEAIQSARSAI